MNDNKLQENGIEYFADVSGDSMTMLEGFVIMGFKDRKANYYKIEKDSIYLNHSDYQAEEKGYIKLPYPLTEENAVDFINNWIMEVDKSLLSGSGQQLGFSGELRSFGEFDIKIKAVMVYYGK